MDEPGQLNFGVAYPPRLKRWLLFVRWILIIPHIVALTLLGMALGVVSFLAWWAILFTGRYPEGMWSFSTSVLRWNARVQAYTLCLRDEYPPFGDEPYPITFSLAYPHRQARWLLFLRPLLIVPHLFCLWLLGMVAGVVTFIAWLSVLILGRMPEGMFSLLVGTQRWTHRVQLYMLMLTDAYPPFSTGQGSAAYGGTPEVSVATA
jgi:hypothetical protein